MIKFFSTLLSLWLVSTISFSNSQEGSWTGTACRTLKCRRGQLVTEDQLDIKKSEKNKSDSIPIMTIGHAKSDFNFNLEPSSNSNLNLTGQEPRKPIGGTSDFVWTIHKIFPHDPKLRQEQASLTLPLLDSKKDLVVAEGRQRPRKQSYRRQKVEEPQEYSESDGGKDSDGDFYDTDSYSGNKGYASETSFDRAKKDNYSDSNQRSYKNDENRKSGKNGGKDKKNEASSSSYSTRNNGRGIGRRRQQRKNNYDRYGGEFSDNGDDYLNAGSDFK